MVCIYCSREQSFHQRENKDAFESHLHSISQNLRFLTLKVEGIKKEMQDFYIKNNKILLKKIKEHIQEWKDILCSVCAQSHLTLCHPMDYSTIPPGSSVHGISQARILKWVAISISRGSSWTRN